MKISTMDVTIRKPLNIIVAVDNEGGFAKDGKIPWHFPEDLKHFKTVTNGSACIMGRKTYEEMLDMVQKRNKKKRKISKILAGRDSFVISNTLKEVEGAAVVTDLTHVMEQTDKNNIFILGGERLYSEALPFTSKIYMTIIDERYECDKFFPLHYINKHFKLISGERKEPLYFVEYERMRNQS